MRKARMTVGDLIDLRLVVTSKPDGAGQLSQLQAGDGLVMCRQNTFRMGEQFVAPSRWVRSTCHHGREARAPAALRAA